MTVASSQIWYVHLIPHLGLSKRSYCLRSVILPLPKSQPLVKFHQPILLETCWLLTCFELTEIYANLTCAYETIREISTQFSWEICSNHPVSSFLLLPRRSTLQLALLLASNPIIHSTTRVLLRFILAKRLVLLPTGMMPIGSRLQNGVPLSILSRSPIKMLAKWRRLFPPTLPLVK